jgi:hypothetical protein
MPTPEEIKKQKELNDLLAKENEILRDRLKLQSESYDLSSTLVEDLKDILGIESRRSVFESGILDINKKINRAIRDQRLEFEEIEDIQKQISRNIITINKAKLFETSLESQLNALGKQKAEKDANRINNIENFNKAVVKQYKELSNILSLSKDERDLRKDEIKELRDKISKNEQLIESNFKNMSLSSKQFYITKKQREELEKINVELKKEEEKRKEIQKQLGIFGGALKGLERIPVLKNLGIDFKEIREEAENTTKATKSGVQGLGAGLKSLGNQIKSSLTNPANITLFVIQQIIDALIKSDKATGELAKAFGTSYNEANNLRNELNNIANSSGDINITTLALQKSLIAVNKEFGTATMLSGELLKDFTQLTEVAGYTNETAARLSKISVATGTDLSKNTAQILGTAKAFNATNKLALNEKEIVEDVAKASKATTLSLGMHSGKLAQAVAQAKALGANLEKVEAISQSLLNFESSISSELEAELITGKDLNLERARMYALNNDIAGVAREIAGQIGTAADFTNTNVIAQEALAKSVGMTREDLAASLIEREALAAIGEGDKTAVEAYNRLKKEGLSDAQIAVRLGDEELANQLKSQSVQERFNASIEKLKEIFVSLAGPILKVISPIVDILAPILSVISGVVGTIASTFGKILGPLAAGYAILKSTQLVLTSISAIQAFITQSQTTQLGLGGSILANLGFQNAALAYKNTMQTSTNKLIGIAAFLEKTILGSIIAQGAAILKNIGRATLELIIKNQIALATLTSSAALTFGVGAAVAVAAALAGYAVMKAVAAGDMYSPADGKTQISTKEGGLFELSPNDDFIAAPGISNMLENDKVKTSSQSINKINKPINPPPLTIDYNKMAAAVAISIAKEINNRPVQVSVEMDGEKVAKGVGNNSTKFSNSMSTNTFQVQ